ncbi:MAG TPA: PTS sugar transporter subunit IIA [Planctomycetota bacterium]|nr:PTS sugar transporter subunit IIA [Planctomycetota bacterium]
MKSLSRLLSPDRIVWLNGSDKTECLESLVRSICQSAEITREDDVLQAILEREKLLSTGFGLGLAIPHAKLKIVRDFVVGLGVHKAGVDFESLDKKPVHILVMILGPSQQQDEYLKVLSRVTAFLRDNRDKLLSLESPDAIYELTLDY